METMTDTNPPPTTPPYRRPGSRLTRSTDDKVLGGLAGGLGRYFGIDPVVFRIAFVVLTLAGGSGILLYLVGWLMIPDDAGGNALKRFGGERHQKLAAAVLAGAGVLILLDNLTGSNDDIPLGLVLVGMGGLFLWSRHKDDAGRRPPAAARPPVPPGPPFPPAPPAPPAVTDADRRRADLRRLPTDADDPPADAGTGAEPPSGRLAPRAVPPTPAPAPKAPKPRSAARPGDLQPAGRPGRRRHPGRRLARRPAWPSPSCSPAAPSSSAPGAAGPGGSSRSAWSCPSPWPAHR